MPPRFSQLLAAALIATFCSSELGAARSRLAPPPLTGPAIAFGDAAVPLNGPWKFSPGDSPWNMNPVDGSSALRSNSPDWTQPGFDDSAWTTVDFTPQLGSIDPIKGTSGYIPGWTRQGHPDIAGFAWYRLTVRLADPSQKLWLEVPGNFNDAFELYVNGDYVGQFGQFGLRTVSIEYPQPVSFPLPQAAPDGRLDLAFRFYMSPATLLAVPSSGGFHQAPVIGLASALKVLQRSERDTTFRVYFGELIAALLFLIVLPLVIWALSSHPRDYAWYALAGALALQVIISCLHVGAELGRASLGLSTFADSVFKPIVILCWTLFWWFWFSRSRERWVPIAASILAVAHIFANSALPASGSVVNASPASELWIYGAFATLALVAQSAVLIFLLWGAVKQHSDEALLTVLPVVLFVLSNFTRALFVAAGVPVYAYPFGLGFSAVDFEQILMILIVAALAARRFMHSSVSDAIALQSHELDLAPARDLQQLVLVREDVHSPYFSVETEYHAAPNVGGDFFLTIPGLESSVYILIGDVSGRGVRTAMLVSMLVGAARIRALQGIEPVSMLQTLDECFSGRSSGLVATCLAAQLFPNGVLRVANAGHLPPYLNGRELDLEGSLPLGIAGKFNPTKNQIQLRQGDILTFMTDGVVEARNEDGDMLGFEYARSLSQKPAADVVSEAQAHGQSDDITVIRVSYIRSEAIGPITPSASATVPKLSTSESESFLAEFAVPQVASEPAADPTAGI